MYNSLLSSHLRYCITSWCFGNRTTINQLQRICNKFIRAMYGIKRRGCVKNVMIKNELLNIQQQLYESKIAILMYKFQKRVLPIPIQQLFSLNNVKLKLEVIVKLFLCVLRTVCQQSIKFIEPKIWNTLPQEIKNGSTLVSFKNKQKIYHLTGAIPDESTKT